MQITLIPMRRDDRLTLARRRDVLIINGEDYDFGKLAKGAMLPEAAIDCPYLVGPVCRDGGMVSLALILPHGRHAPHETLFPEVITVVADGPIPLPPYDAVEHSDEN